MTAATDLRRDAREPEAGFALAAVMAQAGSENFPVATRVLPRRLREDLLSIYGFARLVDDVGDELAGDRLAGLDAIEAELEACFSGRPAWPVFAALAPTIERHGLEIEPFRDLIEANRRDQSVTRYATYEELESYCALSAVPVGRLVLGIFDASSASNRADSDRICTALQVVEHLQDLAEDFRAGRIYLPLEDLARFGAAEDDFGAATATPALRRVVAFEAARARVELEAGSSLIGAVHGAARFAIAGFVGGGLAQIDALADASFDVLGHTVKASKAAVLRRTLGCLRKRTNP